jgi:hypothetical protein
MIVVPVILILYITIKVFIFLKENSGWMLRGLDVGCIAAVWLRGTLTIFFKVRCWSINQQTICKLLTHQAVDAHWPTHWHASQSQYCLFHHSQRLCSPSTTHLQSLDDQD